MPYDSGSQTWLPQDLICSYIWEILFLKMMEKQTKKIAGAGEETESLDDGMEQNLPLARNLPLGRSWEGHSSLYLTSFPKATEEEND